MNLCILFIWINFCIMQNNYFGWNFLPKSDAEMVTDTIGWVILAMAFLGKEPTQ